MEWLNGHSAKLPAYPDHPSERRQGANGKPKRSEAKQQAAGRFQDMNAFIDFSMGQLTRAEIVTWFMLFRDCRDGVARTSQADISKRGGLSVRAVKLAVAKLTELGLLKVVNRGGLNKGASSYHVRPLPEAATGEPYFPSTGELQFPRTGAISCTPPGNRTSPIPEGTRRAIATLGAATPTE